LKGLTAFEKYLIEHEIRQILGRAQHPQTNGKIERFFRTVDEKIQRFKKHRRADTLVQQEETPHVPQPKDDTNPLPSLHKEDA